MKKLLSLTVVAFSFLTANSQAENVIAHYIDVRTEQVCRDSHSTRVTTAHFAEHLKSVLAAGNKNLTKVFTVKGEGFADYKGLITEVDFANESARSERAKLAGELYLRETSLCMLQSGNLITVAYSVSPKDSNGDRVTNKAIFEFRDGEMTYAAHYSKIYKAPRLINVIIPMQKIMGGQEYDKVFQVGKAAF